MKNPRLILATSIALLTALAPFASAADPAKPEAKFPEIKVDTAPLPQNTGRSSYAPVVEKVSPSVVTIATSKLQARTRNPYFNDPMFRKYFGLPEPDAEDDAKPQTGPGKKRLQRTGLGSGVVVAADGYILTNNHVIDGADEIIVTFGKDKKEYKATKIGNDPATDVAVLKIDAANLTPITFADSSKIRVGDISIAIGNPFNLTQTVTMGIVSALGRSGIERGMSAADNTRYEDFIQTDASINPGNSGGALVDVEGRLIGINTAIFSMSGGNQGIGFAVPANLARTILESLIKTGKVSRGFLGVALQPLSEELAKQFKFDGTDGALIAEVTAKSPAEKAGLQYGDIVTEVGGKKVEGTRELQFLIASMAPGSKADLKVLRDGQDKAITVELGERPASPGLAATPPPKAADPDVLDGVTVGDLDPEVRKKFDIPEATKGVVIAEIDPESPSAEAGLKVGDVILDAKGQNDAKAEAVTSAKQAVELSEKLKKEKQVRLRVSTRGASRYVIVERKD